MMAPPAKQETTRILKSIAAGDPTAAERLLPLVYNELRALAASFLQQQRPDHTLQPTALVHEAYLRMIDQTDAAWTTRAHFFAVAAKAMRQILIDHARAHRAAKRGGGWHRVTLEPAAAPARMRELDLVALGDALARLQTLDERQCQVVELRPPARAIRSSA